MIKFLISYCIIMILFISQYLYLSFQHWKLSIVSNSTFVRQALAFRHRSPHVLGAIFKFAAQPACFDGLFLAIPFKSLNTHSGVVTPKTPKAFHKGCFHTHACGGQSTGARPNHQNISFIDDINLFCRFCDCFAHVSP